MQQQEDLSCVVGIGCVPWNDLKMSKASFRKKPMSFKKSN
jgi:hypothetical protein